MQGDFLLKLLKFSRKCEIVQLSDIEDYTEAI